MGQCDYGAVGNAPEKGAVATPPIKCLIANPWSLSAGHEPTTGADHEEIDERAALCCAETGGQGQGQAQARQIGHNGGAKARSGNGAAVCGPAFNDAPSYRAAEAPIGREVQREALSTMVPDEIERDDAVVIAGEVSPSMMQGASTISGKRWVSSLPGRL